MNKPVVEGWEERFRKEFSPCVILCNKCNEPAPLASMMLFVNLESFISAEISRIREEHKQGVENIIVGAIDAIEKNKLLIVMSNNIKDRSLGIDEAIRQIRDLGGNGK